MRAFKAISDPEAFQLMADETRRRIVYLLRAKEMTVAQIAEALSLTPQAIYHHIRKMKDAGLVEVAKEERVEHFIETYYRASAEMFQFTMGKNEPTALIKAQGEEALRQLSRLGFQLKEDPDVGTKILDLMKKMEGMETAKHGLMEKIATLDDVDFLTKQTMEHFATLLTITDEEASDYVKCYREQRKLLRSLLISGPATDDKVKVAVKA